MASFVPLLTPLEISNRESYTLCRKMKIFTCSISRPSGVLLTKSTTKLNATTLTIGRISVASHNCTTTMFLSLATIGSPRLLLENMKKDVSNKLLAREAMDGKNKNTILIYTRQDLAKKISVMEALIVHTITMKMIRE